MGSIYKRMTLTITSPIIRASYCFTYHFFSEFKLDEIHFIHLFCIYYILIFVLLMIK